MADLLAIPRSAEDAANLLGTLYRAVQQSDYWTGDRATSVRAMVDDQARLAATLALGITPGMPDHPDHPPGLLSFFSHLIGNALLSYEDYLTALASGASPAIPMDMRAIARAVTGFVQDKAHEIRYVEFGVLRSAWEGTYHRRDLERGTQACVIMHPKSTTQRPIGLLCLRDAPEGTCSPYGRNWPDGFSFATGQVTGRILVVGLVPHGLVLVDEPCDAWAHGSSRVAVSATDFLAMALTRFCGWGAGAAGGTPTSARPSQASS